ncbi:hypothetical protein SOJ17_000895 [Metallosphaera sedula DSM 5348]|nr:hypothetical protein [Metallosphaera sedula]WPX07144.1 hypothetical protein SOJ17_000895 [Metallosphaera sedula DSM 5348]
MSLIGFNIPGIKRVLPGDERSPSRYESTSTSLRVNCTRAS